LRAFWHSALLTLLAVGWALPLAAQDKSAGLSEGVPTLKPDDAERLFLSYIYDRSHLVRNCMFLGGVRLGDITYKKIIATTEIRYRIQCVQEAIDMPPLDRTLKEDFLYRFVTDHWEILGRASEVSPAQKEATGPAPSPAPGPPDPTRDDRRKIAEEILAWAVTGARPQGTDAPFPGGRPFPKTGKILVSNENLDGLETLALPGREVMVLSPEALLQRTILLGGGVWLRFESLVFEDKTAHAVIGVAAPVIPDPGPGGEPIHRVFGMSAEFVQRQDQWVMTRFNGN
jgi:hypothetical protein